MNTKFCSKCFVNDCRFGQEKNTFSQISREIIRPDCALKIDFKNKLKHVLMLEKGISTNLQA